MTACVYAIVNSANNKVYVGKTNNVVRRWTQHVSAARSPRPRMIISRALRKYGSENFSIIVLEEFETEEEALWWEGWYISYLETRDFGYNLDSGGHGGKSLSASTRQKLSIINRGRKLSAEHIAKMSAANLGKKLSPEVRKRMSAAKLGKKRDPAIAEKVAKALRGRKMSSEAIAKMSVARTGKKLAAEHVEKVAAANRGKKRSPESRAKISASMKGRGLGKKQSPETVAKRANSLRAWWKEKRRLVEDYK